MKVEFAQCSDWADVAVDGVHIGGDHARREWHILDTLRAVGLLNVPGWDLEETLRNAGHEVISHNFEQVDHEKYDNEYEVWRRGLKEKNYNE